MRTRRDALFLATAAALMPAAARAQSPAAAATSERTILTISGNITKPNRGKIAAFDRGALEAMGLVSFETTTPWHTGKVRFEGVPMTRLLEVVGAEGKSLVVTALNDYSTVVPIEDFARFGVIMALKRDGNYMPVSDKGPLFIVYPYDTHAELKSQKYYSRSAWQVARIEVK